MRNNLAPSSANVAIAWSCPVARPLGLSQSERARRLYEEIAPFQLYFSGPVDVIGLELRTAYAILAGHVTLPVADNEFWSSKIQSLLRRPAVEPVALAAWRQLSRLELDQPLALGVARGLGGTSLVYREGPAIGISRHGNVAFESVEVSRTFLGKILEVAGEPELLTMLPMYAFAQTLMAHPFSDANGRFARVMVLGALARVAGLQSPCLPLGPAFYRNARALGEALHALSRDGDWNAFSDVFLLALGHALASAQSFAMSQAGALRFSSSSYDVGGAEVAG